MTTLEQHTRIESASLDGNPGEFLGFTQEVSNLASSAQLSIVACSKDHEQLSDALEVALRQQLEFEKHYRDQLVAYVKTLAIPLLKKIATPGRMRTDAKIRMDGTAPDGPHYRSINVSPSGEVSVIALILILQEDFNPARDEMSSSGPGVGR